MSKSYVTLEQEACVVCGQEFDTGSLLLDTQLKERFDRHTVTGWGMCPTCEQLKTEGFIALIGAQNTPDSSIKPEDADRTGELLFIKLEAFKEIFKVPPPKKGIAFVTPEVCAQIKEWYSRVLH